jgi:hypothetical protein
MTITVATDGTMRMLYAESFPLSDFGRVTIRRASHVEPTDDGQWMADMQPVNGPQLGPFATRSAALAAEVAWLESNIL